MIDIDELKTDIEKRKDISCCSIYLHENYLIGSIFCDAASMIVSGLYFYRNGQQVASCNAKEFSYYKFSPLDILELYLYEEFDLPDLSDIDYLEWLEQRTQGTN